MAKKNTIWFVVIVAFLTFSIFLLTSNMGVPNADNTLTAYKGSGSVTLDATATESFWDDAASLVLSDVGSSTVDITLLAKHDGTYLYVYANWTDATKSDTRKGWEYNGTHWSNVGGNEDRLNFAWSNDSLVSPVCGHNPGDSSGLLFDVWHWKATRTDPAGWADDKYWDGSGRHSDAKTAGGYKENSVVYQAADAAEITSKLGNSSSVSSFSNDDRPYWDASGNVIAWSNGVNSTTLSDTITGYKTDLPTGSRGDVNVASNHDGSAWHVEYKRKLDTGNLADDIAFEVGTSYTFYVSFHDNSGDNNHEVFGGSSMTALTLDVSSATGPSAGSTPGFLIFVVPLGILTYIAFRKTRK
ncbi:MAG: ethylbenzene dehydrogenase-related protein [Candidatus Hodarchaeales archaeon]|jgi:hypothetical protein